VLSAVRGRHALDEELERRAQLPRHVCVVIGWSLMRGAMVPATHNSDCVNQLTCKKQFSVRLRIVDARVFTDADKKLFGSSIGDVCTMYQEQPVKLHCLNAYVCRPYCWLHLAHTRGLSLVQVRAGEVVFKASRADDFVAWLQRQLMWYDRTAPPIAYTHEYTACLRMHVSRDSLMRRLSRSIYSVFNSV
jgi:hypothetical protein